VNPAAFLLPAVLLVPVLAAGEPVVRMLVPGFTVQELPVRLSNQNNVRFAPDGSPTTLGYDGRVWTLRDTDGDGLEDTATPYWDRPTLRVPLGMAWSTRGLFVSSQGKVSLLRDTDGDGRADEEDVVASGWPRTDVGSGGVDATAVLLDAQGNIHFGLLVADYSNAYRLRKRKELKPEEAAWLKAKGRPVEGDPEEEVSLYDLDSPRGTIQRIDARTHRRTTLANGIRVPVSMAFSPSGDLFGTDQEGETWMPDGNPLDELNLLVAGRNYGFPPVHPRWLPGLVSEPPVVGFGPQHQSACGLVFNVAKPRTAPPAASDVALPVTPGQAVFGPPHWSGNALVAGQSRGKIWRVELVKTPTGYVGRETVIARLGMLTTDVAVSPRGDLYVVCHSGPPDWGTGPQGEGKIFRIRFTDPSAPQPLHVWAAAPTEVRVAFDHALDPCVLAAFRPGCGLVEFGEHVRAADRFETLKPSYEVVRQQDATPRGRLDVLRARLEDGGRTLVVETLPHPLAVTYALTVPGVKSAGSTGPGETVDVDYDLAASRAPDWKPSGELGRAAWTNLPPWAPRERASSGTTSRPPAMVAGDWENGRGLFHGTTLQCARCHRVRGDGATVGPDLGNLVHRDRDSVLRDIRTPDAVLHPDYVTYVATLKNGDALTGFLRAGASGELRVADVEGRERTVARDEVAELRPSGHSLMPSGLLDALTEDQVRDLLTYLLHEPVTRSRAEVEGVLKSPAPVTDGRPMNLVLVASKQDHGPGQHDYPAWQKKWAGLLATVPTAAVQTAWEWPTEEQWKAADVVVLYFWNHDWSAARYAQLDAFQARGGGLVLIHAAVIADTDPERLAERIGLSAQPARVKYRHMPFELRLARGAAITGGLPETAALLDEPYWPLVGDAGRVAVLASAEVDGAPRPLVWTFQRGPGRVFASIPGHYTWTLDDPLWRVVVLRGIAWAGKRELPALLPMALREANLRRE